MKYLAALVMAALLFGPGDGKKNGRKGNALYGQEQYADAAAAYEEGIRAVQEGSPGAVHSGLLNNLGSALYRSGEHEQAGVAFASAATMAQAPADLVRASYNAGNAAFQAQQLEQSLEHYRGALLSDPSNANAKFNYEFVKRRLQEQQQQQQEQQQDQENQENQDQQQDQQNQDGEQDQENQDQQQQQDQDSDGQENQDQQQQEQQQQEREDPTQLSEEEAQRILQALENEEEQLLRQVQKMKSRPRRVEKDW